MTCHQPNGQGFAGTFPPLAGSEYATAANVSVPIRIVMRGMQGPLTVKGVQYNGIMPAYGVGIEMSTRKWQQSHVGAPVVGNKASAVTADEVAKERAAQTAKDAVTAAELKLLM